jgi:geranylgeranyl pyrophosphate synthase
MHILAWQYLIKTPHHNLHSILQTFGNTCLQIHEGQQYDMNFEQRNDVTISEYMEMIRLKTAVLLAGALKIGALYAGANEADTEAVYNFGIETGLAFQLRDDLLDGENTEIAQTLLPIYYDKALHAIVGFPPSEITLALRDLTVFCAERNG